MSDTVPNEMEPGSGVCPICGESNNTTQIYKMYSDLLNGSHPQDVQGIAKKQLTIMVSPPTIVKSDGLSSLHPDLLALILFIIFAYLFAIQLVEKGPLYIYLWFGYWSSSHRLIGCFAKN